MIIFQFIHLQKLLFDTLSDAKSQPKCRPLFVLILCRIPTKKRGKYVTYFYPRMTARCKDLGDVVNPTAIEKCIDFFSSQPKKST